MPELDIATVQEQVERFMVDTQDARAESEKCRDYFDHKQWTEAEAAKLISRNQAPIVVNRVRPKIKGLVGLYNLRESDPKAYPRTQKHEKSAHAITDALRYIADNSDFGDTKNNVAEEFFVEGYGGAAVVVKENKNGDIEIAIDHIPWDRIYFDPHSRRKDFKDARYIGFYLWMYADEAKEKFPDADIEQLIADSNYYTDETTEDRPRWVDKDRKRIRVAVHFCIHKSKWYMSVFSDNAYLIKPELSPYLDEFGEPECPIELVSANIDRDNNRYGEVLGFLDQQDEINHRRSKFLHLVNQRQTFGRKGSVEDIPKLKRELSKPDGHVEFGGEEWGKDFGVIPTVTQINGQVQLYQDAKAELDAISYNAQLSGERQQGDLSGIAIEKLQAAGTIELNTDYTLLANWEKRIYRKSWSRVKQYWDKEKWIRVTDDQDSLRWVGLNTQMTVREFLEEKVNDESIDIPTRRKFAASYQFLIANEAQQQDMQSSEMAAAQLDQVIGVRNPIPELDMDIILEQSFDSVNIQSEQFKLLAQFASSGDIDIIELIELSQLRGKDELIEKIEKRRAAAAEAAQGGDSLEDQQAMAKIQESQKKIQLMTEKQESDREIKSKELEIKERELEIKQNENNQKATEYFDKKEMMSIERDKAEAEVIASRQMAESMQGQERMMSNIAELIREAANQLTKPKVLVRDETGRAIGVETVNDL